MVKMYFTPTKVNTFFFKKNLFLKKLKIYNWEDFRQGVSSLGPLTAHLIHWSSPRGPRGSEFASSPPMSL